MQTSQHLIELRCAEAIAREAGKRVELARRAGVTISYKGRNDLVTDADRDTETFLREQLRELFPQDRIFGEEYGEEGLVSEPRQWLLDPIDGTTNFSHNIPIYCVSVALQIEGQTVVGAIYDPTRAELFSARRGGGAWLNGERLRVTEEVSLKQAVLATGFPPVKEGDTFEAVVLRMGHVVSASRGMRRLGSAALDMAYVAAGRLDGFWEYNLSAWDTAAGYLLVEEAGGRVTTAHGEAYVVSAPSVVATNAAIHDQLLAALKRADIT